MSRILLSVPVSDAVQVATLNLGDYLYFQCMFPKDALDLFHLSESELENAKENKRQSRILGKGKYSVPFLVCLCLSFCYSFVCGHYICYSASALLQTKVEIMNGSLFSYNL